ncbi:Lanosterol synthase (Oxidosqualene--lanosterol cyclase) [Microbotryomycetes sp. JL221]|nr:Lanosterol synthase (Oxidosqualene--lanosterol cyclase) [Microbotryomycetes sp. JL221]
MALPTDYPPAGPLGQTDPTRWRLDSSNDRHVWHYTRSDDRTYEQVWGQDQANLKQTLQQSDETKYWLGLELDQTRNIIQNNKQDPFVAAQNGYEFYKRLQAQDGHWAGEYGGPMFLLPGIVIAMYVTNIPIPQEWSIEITRYLANLQRQGGADDQGWGIHIEAKSSVFGTGLNYVALRLLGVDADEPMMIKARSTLHALGGCTGIPAWGKFWLSVLNVHDWKGVNPIPGELWLLPSTLPFHPSKWWIHTRNVYIPMGYLNGLKFQTPLNPLLESLRNELYTQPYNTINWSSCRNKVAPVDLYAQHSTLVNVLFKGLTMYETIVPQFVRKSSLKKTYELIKMEDENTSYQTVGPVSKAIQMICCYVEEGPDSKAFQLHIEKVRDFMWMSQQGMMMTGTNGSQLWDTAFITQALVEGGLAQLPQNKPSVVKSLKWLDHSQIRTNPRWFKQAFRHQTKGAWPFSTKEQGYTVSDCTAEALKSVIMLQKLPGFPQLVTKERMCDAVDVILSMINSDGGWASYELIRGSSLLELLNPAEVFANIMIEYSYPECVTALSIFRKQHSDYRSNDIEQAIKGGIRYIKNKQRKDGSWYGSWAICFTYAMMFTIESLSLADEHFNNSNHVKRACEFLLSKQMKDGGWGESYKSCETEQYVHNDKSQVVNTAWAVIGLITAQHPDKEAIRKGCQLIMSRQLKDGSWAQECIEGVFNKNAAISYPNYKFAFTIKALGMAAKYIGPDGWST